MEDNLRAFWELFSTRKAPEPLSEPRNFFEKIWRMFMALNMDDPRHILSMPSSGRMYKEIKHHWKYHRWIIHPYGRFRTFWDTYFTLHAVTTVMCFHINSSTRDYFLPMPKRMIRLIFDIPFVLNIILNFRTGFISSQYGRVILEYNEVATNYITRGTFLIELLSLIIGSDLYDLLFYQNPLTVRRYIYLVLKFMPKSIAQNFRLHAVEKKWLNSLSHYYELSQFQKSCILRLFKIIVYVTFFSSLICVSKIELNEEDVEVNPYAMYESAVINLFYLVICHTSPFPESMFKKHEIEKAVVLVAFLFCYFNLMVGYSELMLARWARRTSKDNFHKLKECLNSITIHDPRLRKRLQLYMDEIFQGKYCREDAIIGALPSSAVEEIQTLEFDRLVHQMPLLETLPENEALLITSYFVLEVYFGNDIVLKIGEPTPRMYFVASGSVAVYTAANQEMTHIESGQILFPRGLVQHLARPFVTVTAVETSHLFALHRDDFLIISDSVPNFINVITNSAQLLAEMFA